MSSVDPEERVWKALADPTRRKLLDLLKEAPKTTQDLAAEFPKLSRFAIMQHLGVLEEAKLIIVKREGRFRWNYLDAAPIQRIYNRWISGYASEASAALLRMKQKLESG